MAGALKLRARDADDLAVLSAHLQDAIVPIVDVAFLADERRFVMVVNRFQWEVGARPAEAALGSDEADEDGPGGPVYFRTNCGVRIERVAAVRAKGVDFKNRGQILGLLALRLDRGALMLDFAGGATIALTIDGLDVKLEDVGEPWPTTRRPEHRFDDAGETA